MRGLRGKINHLVRSNIFLYAIVRYLSGRWLYRIAHEQDFEAFQILRKHTTGDGIFLDVGANDGISALTFRMYVKETPIVSIEPNKHHLKALNRLKRRIGNFDYHVIGAGKEYISLDLFTPIYRGIALTSFASLSSEVAARNLPSGLNIRGISEKASFSKTNVSVVPLDSLKLSPDFVKIDVEGFEEDVVEGLQGTISSLRPILMIEYNEKSYSGVSGMLGKSGYKSFVFVPENKAFQLYIGQATVNIFYFHESIIEGLRAEGLVG